MKYQLSEQQWDRLWQRYPRRKLSRFDHFKEHLEPKFHIRYKESDDNWGILIGSENLINFFLLQL